jgi:Fe-S cluster biogenesis protein NfuA/nitrite reductase/ring-hydroxylating ferredoxin subunit
VNVEAVGQRVERLLEEITGRDPVAAELTEDLVRELMALYGAGLARILDRLYAADPDALRQMATDPLVGGLLMLHDLHPDDVAARVEGALEGVRPYLASHGGGVQLLDVTDGVARLRLEGSCDGCGSSQVTLQHAVEGAVLEAAPEIERIEVEGAAAVSATPLIPAESLLQRPARAAWEPLPVAPDHAAGIVTAQQVNGARLAVLQMDDQLYAYRDACPACGGSLTGARARGDSVDCPGCGRTYDVRHAGRAAGGGPHLDPVPLLQDASGVRVAVAALGTTAQPGVVP